MLARPEKCYTVLGKIYTIVEMVPKITQLLKVSYNILMTIQQYVVYSIGKLQDLLGL